MGTIAKKIGKVEEVQEVVFNSNSLVDTFWNQFEQSMDQARNFNERSEESYLNSIKEVVKFNQQFRGTFAGLFQTSKQLGSGLVKDVSSSLKVEENQAVSPELMGQFSELSERLEELTMSPVAASLELIQRFEENLVEGSERYVHYARELREGLQKVTDGYMYLAKDTNKNLVHRLEESGKDLVTVK
jgi:hypothetical protein